MKNESLAQPMPAPPLAINVPVNLEEISAMAEIFDVALKAPNGGLRINEAVSHLSRKYGAARLQLEAAIKAKQNGDGSGNGGQIKEAVRQAIDTTPPPVPPVDPATKPTAEPTRVMKDRRAKFSK